MPADGRVPREVWLAARSPGAPGRWLLLDARAPGAPREAGEERGGPAVPAGALVVTDGPRAELRSRPGGGLLVTRPFLWALLDPCAAGGEAVLAAADGVGAEQALRGEGRRLWARLAAFAALDPALRDECRGLLSSFAASAGRLWDTLTSLAAASEGNPFAGWTPPVPRDGERPAAAPRPLPDDPEELGAWLADPAGLGALYGDDFTPRAQQAEMATEVARRLAEGRPLLIEAGTGSGKTLAYLVPLLAAVARGAGRACIATHTRALQGQLLEHDLPRLATLFPALRTRRLMGRRNYLCRRRRLFFLQRPVDSFASAALQASFRLWLAATAEGQREELAGHPWLEAHLGELFDSPEPCSPSVCHQGDDCFVQRARRAAREADVVVVNHSLLMNDFAAGRTLIGPYTLLVVDEAHRLPPVALETHAVRCDPLRVAIIEELIGEVRPGGGPPEFLRHLAARVAALPGSEAAATAAAIGALGDAAAGCFAAYRDWLAAIGREFDARAERQSRPLGRVRVHDGAETYGALRTQTTRLLAAAAGAGAAYAAVARQVEGLPDLPADAEEDLGTVARAGELLAALERDVRFVTAADDEAWVYWLEPAPETGVRAAGATPLESGDLLRAHWQAAGLAPVLTSATLAVGEDFAHMLGELGLRRFHPAAATALIASPFDYERQALFLTLSDIPPPDRPDFPAAVARLVSRLTQVARRKTLVLFTAYKTLARTAQELQGDGAARELFALPPAGDPADDAPAPPLPPPVILAQTAGADAHDLLARFRRERRAVLLGTTTFWEGVDFPGHELEILVVTKLPFLVPDDPWVEARRQRLDAAGENGFETFVVRDAVLRLRQGIGRLIRRADDRGVVVLLDSRLHSRPYGITFLNALPASPRYCTDAAELAQVVADFFAGPA